MRDFILSFPTEADAIAALPDYRRDDAWTGPLIPNCDRWIQRPVYDAEGEIVTPPESVPGWHCIIRAASLPAAAQPYLVTEDTDIEPIPSGGLLVPVVPEEVSALQALLAIDRSGLSTAYREWAESPLRTFAQNAFMTRAQTWRRDDPTLLAAAESLGLTGAQLDELFLLAETR